MVFCFMGYIRRHIPTRYFESSPLSPADLLSQGGDGGGAGGRRVQGPCVRSSRRDHPPCSPAPPPTFHTPLYLQTALISLCNMQAGTLFATSFNRPFLQFAGAISPWSQAEGVTSIIPEEPQPGNIKEEHEWSLFGATQLTLSNGMRVRPLSLLFVIQYQDKLEQSAMMECLAIRRTAGMAADGEVP